MDNFSTTLKVISILNFLYFFVEFIVASKISSVSLFSDSLDFLEDAALNFLILISMRFSRKFRANLGMFLSALFLIPASSALITVWKNIVYGIIPNSSALSITGLGALIINLFCAYLLVRHKNTQGSLSKLAFYSARNDAIANIAIITSGILIKFFDSPLPDIITGLGIFFMNISAAKEVYITAKKEKMQ